MATPPRPARPRTSLNVTAAEMAALRDLALALGLRTTRGRAGRRPPRRAGAGRRRPRRPPRAARRVSPCRYGRLKRGGLPVRYRFPPASIAHAIRLP